MKECEHNLLEEQRFKDLIYDCDLGERTVTIYIEYCKECGEIHGVRNK